MAIERYQSRITGRTEIIDECVIGAWLNVDWKEALSVEELLGSVRAIPMSPAPEFGYDPIPLIRNREKTRTVRGGSRILGTINQVSVGGTRIPVWIQWTARERTAWAAINNDEFAYADGIRPTDGMSPAVAMKLLFCKFHAREPQPEDMMWVMDFEIFADLMDELEGRWEL